MQLSYQIDWGELRAIEPSLDEVSVHARTLAEAYNEPRNAPLLGHTAAMSEAEVLEHYESLYAHGARPFLLLVDGALANSGGSTDVRAGGQAGKLANSGGSTDVRAGGQAGKLVGDADVRGIALGKAEFAFLIASPDRQGKGLGTRFATMIHAYAFGKLGVDRMFASVVPVNVASRRVFEKLGYHADDSDAARGFADPGDVTMSLDRGTFERRHAAAVADIRIRTR